MITGTLKTAFDMLPAPGALMTVMNDMPAFVVKMDRAMALDAPALRGGSITAALQPQLGLYPTGAMTTDARASVNGNIRAVETAPSSTARAGTPARSVQPGDRGASAAAGEGDSCASSCLGSVSTVHRQGASGQCLAWFRVPCDPYGCDDTSGMCRQSCANDTQCGQGAKCNTSTGMCTAAPPACIDASTVRLANGQTESCSPYECRAGSCRETCESSNDCASGFGCNSYGRCVKVLK